MKMVLLIMSIPRYACLILSVFALLPAFAVAQLDNIANLKPNLGKPATATEIAAWDISIMPDGAGLPGGQGDAKTGETLYNNQCAACHGPAGIGGSAEHLVGEEPLNTEWADKTIGLYWPYAKTLFNFIRRSMPPAAPASLSNNEVYSLTAYLLALNGIIEEQQVLNAEVLAAIEMPNRNGFIRQYDNR